MNEAAQIVAEPVSAVNYTARQIRNFWRRVVKTDGCWLWTGTVLPRGYGRMKFRDGVELTHRVSWILHFGPIPSGMCVCHACDTPGCVRPDHLWLGTNADNNRDKMEKGRQAKGEKNGAVKLTEATVRLIRARYDAGESQCSLMREFDIHRTRVFKIVHRVQWRHLSPSMPLPNRSPAAG